MYDLRNLSRRNVLSLAGATGASLLLPPGLIKPAAAATLPAVDEKDAIFAFGHVGPITDEGWTWSHNEGMKAIQAAFPKIRMLMVENIPYSADASRTFRQFVSQNAHMVFSTSNYGDFLFDVVSRSPKVAFMEADGRHLTDNFGWYYIQHWNPTYVVGIAAGLMSKSGKLGYVASFPVPSVYSSTNAFIMGARSVNPKATVQVISINSWFDPQGAAQAGTALIDNGCDFLFGIMDEAAYLQVAERRGVPAAMWNSDIRRYGPKSYVSSIVCDWKAFYVDQARKRLAGTWTGAGTLLPMGAGIDRDAWGESVPMEVQQKADAVRTKILGGYNPFVGELKDNKGQVRLAAGKTMNESELYNWDWSVEGVLGLSK
jgi:basic membrane protein A and related proteins